VQGGNFSIRKRGKPRIQRRQHQQLGGGKNKGDDEDTRITANGSCQSGSERSRTCGSEAARPASPPSLRACKTGATKKNASPRKSWGKPSSYLMESESNEPGARHYGIGKQRIDVYHKRSRRVEERSTTTSDPISAPARESQETVLLDKNSAKSDPIPTRKKKGERGRLHEKVSPLFILLQLYRLKRRGRAVSPNTATPSDSSYQH